MPKTAAAGQRKMAILLVMGAMEKFTDNVQLLEAIKQENAEAFEYLFKSYYPRLLGYALRFVPTADDARDLVQECFMVFWEKKENLTFTSLSSLLFTMVRNSCLNYLKHRHIVQKHQISYLSDLAGQERLYHADFLMNADGQLLYDEFEKQVSNVLDSLPERCREVFLLSRFEGLKNREIAAKLSISTTAVEKHIARAITAFKQHFKDKYSESVYILILLWLAG